MKSVETETDAEIADAIKFYEPEFINSPSNYESSSYETCEKAAFDLKFGRDKWKIRFKDEEDDYQGTTRLVIFAKPEQAFSNGFYLVDYGWGSCGGCDVLEGDGAVEATKMIRKAIHVWESSDD